MATQLQDIEQPQSRAVVPMSESRENYAIMKDKARNFAMSQLIPDSIRGKNPDEAFANCLIALELANLMQEAPLVVMQNIHIVKGKAGFSAQYMIARANSSGVFKGRINWRESGQGDTLSVTAFAFLADGGEEVSFTCDMAMAKAEGWTSNSKYKSMGALMLRYRSATFLVRLYAPDVMLGYHTAEEHDDMLAAAGPASSPLTGAKLLEQASHGKGDIVSAGNAETRVGHADDQDAGALSPSAPASDPVIIDNDTASIAPQAGGQEEGEAVPPADPSPATEGRTDEQHGDQHNFDVQTFQRRLKRCETRIDFEKLDEEFQAVAHVISDEDYHLLKPLVDRGRAAFNMAAEDAQ